MPAAQKAAAASAGTMLLLLLLMVNRSPSSSVSHIAPFPRMIRKVVASSLEVGLLANVAGGGDGRSGISGACRVMLLLMMLAGAVTRTVWEPSDMPWIGPNLPTVWVACDNDGASCNACMGTQCVSCSFNG